MATVINKRDVDLQAASPRTVTVNLGSTVNVSGTVSGNVTGTLDGSPVTTVVNAALSATANYFTTSASNPTGGSDGDAHYNSSTNVMWFKIAGTWTQGGTVNASAITAGTLAAARIAAGSITADKLSVSSLSAVSANLGTVTAGSITSSSDIDVTGRGVFGGAYSSGGYTAALHANMGGASQYGLVALAGASGIAVVGVAGSGDTAGIQGTSGVSGVPGMWAVNSAGGTALKITGDMTISSSALVSNLRSATCLLADNSTKWNGFSAGSITTGAATATFVSTNKPGSATSNSWLSFNDSGGTGWVLPVWRTT